MKHKENMLQTSFRVSLQSKIHMSMFTGIFSYIAFSGDCLRAETDYVPILLK